MFVIWSDEGRGYVLQEGGWIHYVADPRDATAYRTRDEARSNRPGHARAMGGRGQTGRVMALSEAR